MKENHHKICFKSATARGHGRSRQLIKLCLHGTFNEGALCEGFFSADSPHREKYKSGRRRRSEHTSIKIVQVTSLKSAAVVQARTINHGASCICEEDEVFIETDVTVKKQHGKQRTIVLHIVMCHVTYCKTNSTNRNRVVQWCAKTK